MSDSERLARAFVAALDGNPGLDDAWCVLTRTEQTDHVRAASMVIASGLVTVTPEPDPAEKVVAEFTRRWAMNSTPNVITSMLDDGLLALGPNL